MKTCALFLCLSLPALGAPDAGTDAPYWVMEPAGTVLQQDAVVATPQNAQSFDIALRSAQSDAAAGTQKATVVGIIMGAIGTLVGILLGALGVAVTKK
jgi:hypothetical protein